MSDYKELVRRLRDNAVSGDSCAAVSYDCRQAADAISELSARLAERDARIEKLSAEVERYRESDLSEAVQRLDETKEAEIKRLKQERDEALAARETYTMTARQDIIEKANALDELEAWLRDPQREAQSAYVQFLDEPPAFRCVVEVGEAVATTLPAAITAALKKASGQGGQ